MQNISEYVVRPTLTQSGEVRAWEETLMLPSYGTGAEEKNPVFLEKRVYQGSSGAVYPYPVVESVSDKIEARPFKALFIENEYLKILILPELGGRVQMAYDKLRRRHFVYYNQVIKPALVGLTGPWISGGIEFNWPQHHRPSTFLPTDYSIERCDDGSRTVWCSELERMTRTKGMCGFTLYPSKAYLEVKVKICNRTSFPQTFLWWANPAVSVNETYHSVFPPDVNAVYDHGKRDVSEFPIARGLYYKHDYSAGVDISKYVNIPVPTSYMAVSSVYDFVGGYDTDARAGLLHVADHHIAPGKKQWTWGKGDFGQAWDRNLTDDDGPYIELMTGVYTDNQPDFSWIASSEEKDWVQYFMPYAELGYVKQANRDALVNVEVEKGETCISLYTTARYSELELLLRNEVSGEEYRETILSVSPSQPYKVVVPTGSARPDQLVLEIRTQQGELLIAYTALKPESKPIPEPAQAARLPEDIESIEQLFLTGLHLEQYRHATYEATSYYAEALRREPRDLRCNNAMGLYLMRRAQFVEAEQYFMSAIATLTERNPNPYEGEVFYNLGCCLRMQGRYDEAYGYFYKATWNASWKEISYLALAQIEAGRASRGSGSWSSVLEKTERCIARNRNNHKARHLKAICMRKLGRSDEALLWIEESLGIDMFNLACRFERYLINGEEQSLAEPELWLGNRVNSYTEYALDYAEAGLYAEASALLSRCVAGSEVFPMVYYTLEYFAEREGEADRAQDYRQKAAEASPDRCFPFRIEEFNILTEAISKNPSDAKAPYYLGNFLYAARVYPKAIACWEQSVAIDASFPTVRRNLALAYYNKLGRKVEAREMLERAFAIDPSDARILMELDGLYKRLGRLPSERLAFLEEHLSLVEMRDDLSVERVALYNQTGRYREARELIATRRFHPWEGGEGKVSSQYVRCRIELAKIAISEHRFAEALDLLHETDEYPHALGEGKLPTVYENDVDYYKGVAYGGISDKAKAAEFFARATKGPTEPVQAFFYNDARPDGIYYQGLAWRALGDEARARSCFERLVEYGEAHVNDECRIDYFAVSLPELAVWDEDLNVRNRVNCLYLTALGYRGLGKEEVASELFASVQAADVNHYGLYEVKGQSRGQ
ncbi:MAG: DUF5107 domain-containing protein [Prevotellaceae bacterium]|nr:DUF5107 domain-containing protein [Prevotellaceae bacterium]